MAEVEAPPPDEGSTFLIALHVVMWTVLACGLIALMVIVMLTPIAPR